MTTPPSGPVPGDRGATLARILLAGLALTLVVTVFGEVSIPFAAGTVALHYKTLWRALPIVWLACLVLPGARARLAPRWHPSDLPLALFAIVATLSVAFGGGHWGDLRSLLAAIGVGAMARTLLAMPTHRRLFVHLLGCTGLLILTRELWVHPRLFPPHEMGRYELITANANVLGFLFAMAFPILLAEFLTACGRRRLLTGLYALTALLGTLLTFSRTAAVGAAAGATIVMLGSLPRGRALLALGVAALAFCAIQRPDQWTRLRTTGDAQRVRILRTSLALAAESPFLGVGFGINNLEVVFPNRYETRHGERVFRFHSMNQLVDLLVGTGIVGTAFALWWAVRLGTTALAHLRKAEGTVARVTAAGGVGAYLAIALMSMAESPLYHGKLLPVLFLVVAAIERGPEPHQQVTREHT